jgi:hypothetical protein
MFFVGIDPKEPVQWIVQNKSRSAIKDIFFELTALEISVYEYITALFVFLCSTNQKLVNLVMLQ